MADVRAMVARVRAAEWRALTGLKLVCAVFVVLAVAFALVAVALGDTFYLRLASEALILAGMAISVDLLLGICGLLSLGQALFFGFGAYLAALTLIHVTQNFWLTMVGVIVAAIPVAALFGWIAIRSRGVYFALITFGYAQVISRIVYNTRALGASDGIVGVPIIKVPLPFYDLSLNNPAGFFFFLLALVVVVVLALWWLLDTPFGRVLSAMRVNENRLPFLGYNVRAYMVFTYVLAALIAAVFGALYPMLRGFVSPELMFFEMSGNALIMVILGGVGTVIGPVFGAVILVGLKSIIGSFTEHHLIAVGGIFIVLVLFFPKGLVGYWRPRVERLLARGDKDGGA
jgi:branched-chain amino acid transport system permease protein